jgi:hypothetical protein
MRRCGVLQRGADGDGLLPDGLSLRDEAGIYMLNLGRIIFTLTVYTAIYKLSWAPDRSRSVEAMRLQRLFEIWNFQVALV